MASAPLVSFSPFIPFLLFADKREVELVWNGKTRDVCPAIFENQWQSFRTRKNRNLELTSAFHTYDQPGRYVVAVKAIGIFGNDTMTLLPLQVG